MDPSVLINGNKEDDRAFNGHRWSVSRILYYMRWSSCLVGLVTGAIVTVYMTLSLMLIILPYIQVGSSSGQLLFTVYTIICGLLIPEVIIRPAINPRGYHPPSSLYLWTINPRGYHPPRSLYFGTDMVYFVYLLLKVTAP